MLSGFEHEHLAGAFSITMKFVRLIFLLLLLAVQPISMRSKSF